MLVWGFSGWGWVFGGVFSGGLVGVGVWCFINESKGYVIC